MHEMPLLLVQPLRRVRLHREAEPHWAPNFGPIDGVRFDHEDMIALVGDEDMISLEGDEVFWGAFDGTR